MLSNSFSPVNILVSMSEGSMQNMGFLFLGAAAGIISGLVGIGGGVILVPSLIYFFGYSQHQAQGTTLALMVPPIGILAAYTYYREGFVDLAPAAMICLGFFLGGPVGSLFAMRIPDAILHRVFGIALLLISVKMIFWDKTPL